MRALQRETEAGIRKEKATARTALRTHTHTVRRLTLVQLAHGVFDMLAQQPTLFGRHMPVTATLIEIGGNRGTQNHVRGRVIDARVMVIGSATARVGRMVARRSIRGRLRMGERRAQRACERTGYRQCNHAQAHIWPNPSLHVVPFVARQPATSDAYTNPGNGRVRKFLSSEVSTEQPHSVKESKRAYFTSCHTAGKFCNRL